MGHACRWIAWYAPPKSYKSNVSFLCHLSPCHNIITSYHDIINYGLSTSPGLELLTLAGKLGADDRSRFYIHFTTINTPSDFLAVIAVLRCDISWRLFCQEQEHWSHMWAHENWSVRTSQAYCASRFVFWGHRTCWRNSIFTPSPKNVLFKTRDLQFAQYPWDLSAKLIRPKWKRLKMRRRHDLGVNFWIIPNLWIIPKFLVKSLLVSVCHFPVPIFSGGMSPWHGMIGRHRWWKNHQRSHVHGRCAFCFWGKMAILERFRAEESVSYPPKKREKVSEKNVWKHGVLSKILFSFSWILLNFYIQISSWNVSPVATLCWCLRMIDSALFILAKGQCEVSFAIHSVKHGCPFKVLRLFFRFIHSSCRSSP